MKVLVVSTSAGFLPDDAGGADTLARHERYLDALRRLAPDSELRVLVLTRRRDIAPGWREAGTLCVAAIQAANPLAGAFAALSLLTNPQRLFAGWAPDLVTSQSPFEDGLFALRLARRLRARHLAQAHFRPELVAEFRPAVRSLMVGPVLRGSDGVRFVSEDQQRAFIDGYRLDRARTFATPAPMTLQSLARAQPPASAGERAPLCLYAGRLVASKRLDLWLAVAQRVAQTAPEVRFLIAGDGPERGRVEALAARLGLDVVFTGDLMADALAALYRQAAVFLLTSDSDSFGRVVAEAGAFGVPVVATACGGPEEIIVDGETGVIRPRGDVEGLAAAVSGLLADAAQRTRLGRAARERVNFLWDADALAERLAAGWLRVGKARG